MTNLYQVLGLEKSASADDIKRAYKKLAVQNHPDKGGDEKKFQEISNAYDVLSDPKKKQEYDSGGSNGNRFNGNHDDIFAHFFGRRGGGPQPPQKCNDIDGAGTSFLQSGCDAGLFLLPDLNVACPVEGSRRRLTSHIPTGISDFTPGSVHVYLHPTLCAYIPSGYGYGGYGYGGGNTPKASYYKVVSTSVDSNGVDQIVIGQCACVKTLDMGEEWNPDTDTCLGENDPNWQLTYTLADLITLTTDGYNELCDVSCGTDYQYFSYSLSDYSTCDEMRASEPMCGGTPAPPATYTEQNWGYCLDYDTRPVVSSADMSQFNDIVLYDGSEAAELGEAWKLTGVTYTQSEAVDAFKAICSALGDKCGAFITLKDASDANNIFSGWVAKFYVSNDCDDPEEIDVFTFFQKDGHVAPPAFGCTSSSCCAEVTCDSNFVCNSGTHLKDDLTGSCASGTCTNSEVDENFISIVLDIPPC